MTISELLLPELEGELAVTRRVLERVPDGRGEWRPHPKSFPLAHLAQLVARLPAWVAMAMQRTELDLAPKGGGGMPGYSIERTATLLATFDEGAKAARAAIAAASDADYQVPWSLKRGGDTMLTQSRYQIVRGMSINHLVHHRAQLGVYLRLLDVPVPQMYGPTADEKW
jgi:hypothetical protein